MPDSQELGGPASELIPPLLPEASSAPPAFDPPNVDTSSNVESVPPSSSDSFNTTHTRGMTLVETITPVGRRARDGTFVMNANRGLGIGYNQPGDSQMTSSSYTIICRDDTVPGESRRSVTQRTTTATRRLVTFDELSPEDQARVLAATDADDEEEEGGDDDTIRGNVDDDDIDGVIDLCEDPPPSSLAGQPQHSHNDQRVSTSGPDLRGRRVSFLSPPTGSITIYDPENATSADGTYELPFAIALPFALGPMMPLIRFILLGWVLGVTLMLLIMCICIGVVVAFWKAVWDLLTGWRKKKDSTTSSSIINSVPALFATFCISIALGFGNICYGLYQIYKEWESMSKQRHVLRPPGRGGQRRHR